MDPKRHWRKIGAAVLVLIALAVIATPALRALADAVYNPRYDVNGDGLIDIVDIQTVAQAWNSSGNPYNDRELVVAKQDGEYLTVGAVDILAGLMDAQAVPPVADAGPSAARDNYYAIYAGGNGTALTAENVTALTQDGINYNIGLNNELGAHVTLRAESYTGQGGQYAQGMQNAGSGTALVAEGVTALGQYGTSGYYGADTGLYNTSGATATLFEGSYTGLSVSTGETRPIGIYLTDVTR